MKSESHGSAKSSSKDLPNNLVLTVTHPSPQSSSAPSSSANNNQSRSTIKSQQATSMVTKVTNKRASNHSDKPYERRPRQFREWFPLPLSGRFRSSTRSADNLLMLQ